MTEHRSGPDADFEALSPAEENHVHETHVSTVLTNDGPREIELKQPVATSIEQVAAADAPIRAKTSIHDVPFHIASDLFD